MALKDEFILKSSESELASNNRSAEGSNHKGRLLLGLGTGRSGSTTLAKLWREQEDCYCSHEHPPRLAWKADSTRLTFHANRFNLLLDDYKYVGDVSHWWLPYIDILMERYDNVRVVVLKRDRKATVDSFLKIKGGNNKGAINHWVDHDGSFWGNNTWDECYPSYDKSTMKEAIEQYWDDYYDTVDSLTQRYPLSIKLFSTEKLSDPDTQEKLLSFCGFTSPKLKTDLYLNKGDALDGLYMY